MQDEKMLHVMDFSINTIYLMGTSFILGSLVTIFVLLLLDFMRRNSDEETSKE